VIGGKLAEADPETVRKFGTWVAAKMKRLKEAARKQE
jgi:hypothetical protein